MSPPRQWPSFRRGYPPGYLSVVSHGGIDEERLRRWLTLLRRPDQLTDPELVDLLVAHGRMPANGSAISIGQAAADLLVAGIERLRPPDESGRTAALPYSVLRTCFIHGRKLYQAASELGMSTRQLTRERSRAIQILMSELQDGQPKQRPASRGRFLPQPIPSLMDFMARPTQTDAIQHKLNYHRLVQVHGAPGVGKTSLIAELAVQAAENSPVLWHRFRYGINDTLGSLLFEIGQHIKDHDGGELAEYVAQALPTPDLTLGSRLALQALSDRPRLLVLDDYQVVEDDETISGLLDEAHARLPNLKVITISRHRPTSFEVGAPFEVSPLSELEVRSLLTKLGVTVSDQLATALHRWTAGICQLVSLAASWLRTATDEEISQGLDSLSDTEGVRSLLLRSLTELISADDHAVLRAASVFRDRFTDDALAFVARRTRGEVQDSSVRLVHTYLATRSKNGDVAFFHNSVRQHVYARIDLHRRAELHRRAARWFEQHDDEREAAYHQVAAGNAELSIAEQRGRAWEEPRPDRRPFPWGPGR